MMVHWTTVALILWTLACLVGMFRPLDPGGGDYGQMFGMMFRLGWLIPLMFGFLAYAIYW